MFECPADACIKSSGRADIFLCNKKQVFLRKQPFFGEISTPVVYNQNSFRLTGLGLLLLCAGKILLVDVWRLDPRDRYLTFIVLGTALLLVSFLYTKNREALRRYL